MCTNTSIIPSTMHSCIVYSLQAISILIFVKFLSLQKSISRTYEKRNDSIARYGPGNCHIGPKECAISKLLHALRHLVQSRAKE